MQISENMKYVFATVGVLLFGASALAYFNYDTLYAMFTPPVSKEVHVHSDFSFYILGEHIDLTAEQYQSSAERINHPTMHFHDGVDTMIHRHAAGITLGEFMRSLGLTLTSDCITLNTGTTYCTDATNTLTLFVNGTKVDAPASYVTQEEDQILLYYGDSTSPDIIRLQSEITDQACMYSGKCPERGAPPFESCGLTCEI